MLLQINYVKTCAPFVVFPTNRIAHFVEVSLYLFYLAQQVKLGIYLQRQKLQALLWCLKWNQEVV